MLFQKRSGPLSSQWKMGRVSGKESDYIVELSYGNASELLLPLNKTDELTPTLITHHTRRDVRTLVKLYSLDDPSINRDIAYLNNWHKMKMRERDLSPNITTDEDLYKPPNTEIENISPQSPPREYLTRSRAKNQNKKH